MPDAVVELVGDHDCRAPKQRVKGIREPLPAPDSGHHEVASDKGAEHWAVIASLVETCKLNAVEPTAYLTDVIGRIVNGHPQRRIDDLLPWAYPTTTAIRAVA